MTRLANRTPIVSGIDDLALVDLDDTIIEVHGHAKAGAGFGYCGVRGLNALAATVATSTAAPVIVATRLRKGSANSARGAAKITADAIKTVHRLRSTAATGMVLLRAEVAYYGRPTVLAAIKAGAQVSITVRQNPTIRDAIEQIDADAWTPIAYPNAVFDAASRTWISRAEVAEIAFTAFASARKADHVPGRLVVRRIPDGSTLKLTRPRRPCSTSGDSTRSSPPTTWTPPPPTRPTAATRSSNRSSQTSRTPPWRTCPRAASPRTAPGSSSPRSRSTSPAPPAPSPADPTPEPAPAPSAGRSSTSRRGSPHPHDTSHSTYQPHVALGEGVADTVRPSLRATRSNRDPEHHHATARPPSLSPQRPPNPAPDRWIQVEPSCRRTAFLTRRHEGSIVSSNGDERTR